MSKETIYTVKATTAKNGGDDYSFKATDGNASFNTKDGHIGASLKCATKDQRLVEAFSKLKPMEQIGVLADLTKLKQAAEISKSDTGSLASGLHHTTTTDPIHKACKQAGF